METNSIEFKEYLNRFESEIVVQGIEAGLLGKYQMVSIRKGKLDGTEFGRALGPDFMYDGPIAIDYYGLIKKSSGLIAKFLDCRDVQVRAIRAPIVHFASIKVEDVSELSSGLVQEFPEFKKLLILLRQFKRK